MQISNLRITVFLSIISLSFSVHADVSLPNIFGDHMVLQREIENPIWGIANPGEQVTVTIDGQSYITNADESGQWRLKLNPIKVGGPYSLKVNGENTLIFEDVLVGEVWLCSGQSNMEFALKDVNHADVELATAANFQIRLITLQKVGTPDAQGDFLGQWKVSTAESAASFSAVGYLFGKRLQNALNVPIGLIDNSWGGSSAEAWVPREILEKDGAYSALLASWDQKTADLTDAIQSEKIAIYKAWEAEGKPAPKMSWPSDPRKSQLRPANLYNGMVHPLLGYGIRGVIWYQGESNAWRAYQYRDLFPLLISTWRDLWSQGDFPFYWVQLANYTAKKSEPADSNWAELREAQTMALSLSNTGQAVIIDAGEASDIHPHDKQTVADRLVRIALAKDYGYRMAYQSPRFVSMQVVGNTVTLNFDDVNSGLHALDDKELNAFSISGANRKFVWAKALVVGDNQVEVSSDAIDNPVAVRYAWANNPEANLYDRNGLPVTPFRTDDWKGVTADNVK